MAHSGGNKDEFDLKSALQIRTHQAFNFITHIWNTIWYFKFQSVIGSLQSGLLPLKITFVW